MENPVSCDMIFYASPQGRTRVEAMCAGEAFWFGRRRMAGLFGLDARTANEYIIDVYDPGESAREATLRKFRIVQFGDNRLVIRTIN